MEDLEYLATLASNYLENRLREVLGRDTDFMVIVSISKDDVLTVRVEVETAKDLGLEIDSIVDKEIESIMKVIRDEISKRFNK